MQTKHRKFIVIFDFDGTLVDSMTDFARIASKVMVRRFGCDPKWAHDQYRGTSGLPFPYQIEKIFPGDQRNKKAVEEFVSEKLSLYQSYPFYEDVEPTLLWLKSNGFRLAISSNNDEGLIDQKIRPLSAYFDKILGFHDGFLKGKAHFSKLKEELNCSEKEMIFIGDSLNDARVAEENNVSFIARLGTFSKQDFLNQGIAIKAISDLSLLKDFLSKPSDYQVILQEEALSGIACK